MENKARIGRSPIMRNAGNQPVA